MFTVRTKLLDKYPVVDAFGFHYEGDITIAGVGSMIPATGESSYVYEEAYAFRNPIDVYDAAKGRKVALARLLDKLGANKQYRTKVWAAYHQYVREAESFLGLTPSN